MAKSGSERTRAWRERDGDYIVLPIEVYFEGLKRLLMQAQLLHPRDLLGSPQEVRTALKQATEIYLAMRCTHS